MVLENSYAGRSVRTDKQIYEIFSVCPEWVFALAGLPAPGPCTVESVTVKETERQIDALIVPRNAAKPMTVVEIQFQRDPLIFERVVMEMAMVRLRHPDREVQGIVFFASPSADIPGNDRWRSMVQVVQLDTVLAQWREKQPDHPLPAVFAPVSLRDKAELAATAARCYRSIEKNRLPARTRDILLKVFTVWMTERFKNRTVAEIAMILDLPDIEKTVSGRELIAKGEARGRRLGESEGRKLGESEGRKLGASEGESRGKAEMLLRIAQHKFGRIPAAVTSAVQALPSAALVKLGDSLLDLPDIAALEKWLRQHKPRRKAD